MASFLSILLFFVYTWGFGFTVTSFSKKQENSLERHIMNIGIGLGSMITLGLLLNLLRIRLHWWSFLAASLAYPLYYLIRNYNNIARAIKNPNIKITKYTLSILAALLIFSAALYVYTKGAFSYPYLEDDDPWSHSLSTKYVAVEKTLFNAKGMFHFIDPYPPAYNFVMGLMHQTNNSIYWTLKFFNALIISLSILFFYFFAKEFTGSHNKALFSAFVLAAIPSYMSHFIWSLALSMALYPVSFYALEKIRQDRKWIIPSAFVIGAAFTSSPSHSFYFGLFLGLYLVARFAFDIKNTVYSAVASAIGLGASLALWWIPSLMRYNGFTGMLNNLGMRLGGGNTLLSVDGTGDRIYLMKDFVFASEFNNAITNPVGIGWIAVILVLISILAFYSMIFYSVYNLKGNSKYFFMPAFAISAVMLIFGLIRYISSKSPRTEIIIILFSLSISAVFGAILIFKSQIERKWEWVVIALLWLVLSFYAVNGVLFPYKVSAFRTWMLLSLPVAVLASGGLFFILGALRGIKIAKFAVVVVIVIGVIITSGYAKYKLNTMQWHPGGFWTYLKDSNGNPISPELSGYIAFKDNVPAGTRVFTFSNDAAVIGFDKFICHWCDDEREFKKTGFSLSADEISGWLKKKNYEYLIIDGQTARKYGANQTIARLQEVISNNHFQLKQRTQPEYGVFGFFLFRVI